MSNKSFEKKELKKKTDNLSDWYTDVIQKAELADYGPAKGTMVIRPYGFSIWERTQEILDSWFKDEGVQNAYFPIFIPMSLLERESEHIEGFSPELAVVTHGGGKELAEPLAVRPTSETIMYEMYSKWINSWRDLPVKINQWNNVVRWELRTYLFIRSSEFLWQEGHTAHETEGEAVDMTLMALEWYRKIYEEYFAMPVITGVKSDAEKFAGAVRTYSVESLMPDGKALQSSTSHFLGQNFSKPFDINFQDSDGETRYVWQTSWGLSTRSIGGLIMSHGDDHGLVMPPKIAPIQVVILPIYKNNKDDIKIKSYISELEKDLESRNIRYNIDGRPNISIGRKFNEWEVKGVPLRIEIGAHEIEDKIVKIVRRDTMEVLEFGSSDAVDEIYHLLDNIQELLFKKASEFMLDNTHEADDYEKFKDIMSKNRGVIKAYWCEDPECEKKIKEETKATTRVKPIDPPQEKGKCILCGKEAGNIWYFAQAY